MNINMNINKEPQKEEGKDKVSEMKHDLFDFVNLTIADLKKFEKEFLSFKRQQYKNLISLKSEEKNFENYFYNNLK